MAEKQEQLIDLIAGDDDPEAIETRMLKLCKEWGIEPIYFKGEPDSYYVCDIDIIDYWGTLQALAIHVREGCDVAV